MIMEKENEYKKGLILGLDISTECIGISIVYDDGENEPKIMEITHISPKIPKNKKGIEALILRKDIFEKEYLLRIKDKGIVECVIESPLKYASGNSNAQTVSQLLQFNGLLSESVYRILGIVPNYLSSHDARMLSFPELLSVRKFNKKGEIYTLSHFKKALRENHLVLFGSYPFDCDKKNVMMNVVNEKYPYIKWTYDKKGELKKQNYDACDSLVCSLAHINKKRYGEIKAEIVDCSIEENEKETTIAYTTRIWDKLYSKKIVINK